MEIIPKTIGFTDEAVKEICQFSQRVPRLINLICDRALLLGFIKEKNIIGEDIIRECVKDIRFDGSTTWFDRHGWFVEGPCSLIKDEYYLRSLKKTQNSSKSMPAGIIPNIAKNKASRKPEKSLYAWLWALLSAWALFSLFQ